MSEAEKIKKENQKRKRIITVKGVCVAIVFALTVWAFTLGWFTESREDEMNGTTLSTEGKGYKILTVGINGRYDKYYSGYKELSDDDAISFKTADGDTLSGYDTGGDYLTWRVTDEAKVRSYDKNADQANISLKNAEYEIFPGTSGYVEFYILPEQAGELKIDFTADITAFELSERQHKNANNEKNENDESKADENTTTDGKSIKYSVESGDDTYTYIYTPTEDSTLANIVKGHIMLFEIDDNGKLNWLTPNDGSFSVTVNSTAEQVSKNIAVRKRIYWVWTGVFGQLVLDDTGLSNYEPTGGYDTVSEILNTLLKASGESDVTAYSDIVSDSLLDVFNVNNGGYFFPVASQTDDEETEGENDEQPAAVDLNDEEQGEDVGEVDENLGEDKDNENADVEVGEDGDESDYVTANDIAVAVSDSFDATTYNKIKKAWNQGDQQIGKKVGFITIDLNVG